MEVNDLRISKLRNYLFEILNTLTANSNYQINANMLSNKVGDYSLDKIPTDTEVEQMFIHLEVASLIHKILLII